MAHRTALVTGASGLVGSAVVNALVEDGWHVLYCARGRPSPEKTGVTWVPYDLRDSLPADFGLGAEVLIHGALASGSNKNSLPVNVAGTRLLLEAARQNGIERRIFLSSLAADAEALSDYGRQKYEIEGLFDTRVDAIVRPGLVIGDGGLFRKLVEQLRRGALVPLIDGGRQPMQTVLDDDLAKAITRIARDRIAGRFTIAEPDPVDYQVFWAEVASQMDVPIRFLPIRFWLADLCARLADKLPIPLPVNRERLLGLKAMLAQSVTSDANVIGQSLHRYDESIRIALPKIVSSLSRKT